MRITKSALEDVRRQKLVSNIMINFMMICSNPSLSDSIQIWEIPWINSHLEILSAYS